MKKRPIYVVGHKNPDTDAIVSAIAYAQYKKALGMFGVSKCLYHPDLKSYIRGAFSAAIAFLSPTWWISFEKEPAPTHLRHPMHRPIAVVRRLFAVPE